MTFALSFLVPTFLIIGGGAVFFVLRMFCWFLLGLVVIRADDILRIECHLAVKTGTNPRLLIG